MQLDPARKLESNQHRPFKKDLKKKIKLTIIAYTKLHVKIPCIWFYFCILRNEICFSKINPSIEFFICIAKQPGII